MIASAGALPVPLEALPFPAFIKDRDGRIIGCNSRFLAWVGLSEEQVMGSQARAVAPPDPAERDLDTDRAVLDTGQVAVFEGQVLRAGGERRDIEIHKSSVTGSGGGIPGLLCVVLDTTERKRTERALTESEARFTRLSELTHEGLLLHRDGRIEDVNEALCRMIGHAREELLGQSYEVLIAPDSLEDVRRRVSLKSGEVYRANLRRRNGSLMPVEVQGRNLIRDGSEVRVVVIHDITERLAAEEAQRRREELYRQMFENNMAVKLLIDPATGRIVDANHAAERFYGWPLETLKSMRITDINALPAEQVQAQMTRVQEKSGLVLRFRHRLASGELRDVEVYSGPVTYRGTSLLHSIICDVTDRIRYQRELEEKTAQLERSNEDLEQFAYVASHDLQAPLRTVVSYLQLLERRYRESLGGDAREFIAFAVQAAKRMGQLIQGLLEYSRLDAGNRPFGAVDLNRVMGAVLANLRFAIDDVGAEVRVGALPVVKGDEQLLASLLQNLLGNALKYRRPGHRPVVEVGARADGAAWELWIADNGIGIAPAYHERIFLLFKRLHGADQYDGTGIGLAACKRIVARHGGRIWVESREGDGATFRFTLPAADTNESRPAPTPS